MKKRGNKKRKNTGRMKSCLLAAAAGILFFTCRTAAMEFGGFDIEVGEGANTEYPSGWYEIPGNSGAVVGEDNGVYWEDNWQQGTDDLYGEEPFINGNPPVYWEDPAWWGEGGTQTDSYIQEYPYSSQWDMEQNNNVYSGQYSQDTIWGNQGYGQVSQERGQNSQSNGQNRQINTQNPQGNTVTAQEAGGQVPIVSISPSAEPAYSVTPVLKVTFTPTPSPSPAPTPLHIPSPSISLTPTVTPYPAENKEKNTKLCYLKEQIERKAAKGQVQIYIEFQAHSPVQVVSLRVNEEEWDWKWEEEGILAKGITEKETLSLELLSICEKNDKVEISVDVAEK